MDISSNLLKTFLAVCEHRNFSAAAVALQKTQSNVSTLVAQLEDRIGLKLFYRDKRPFRLTEAGTIFHQFAKEVNNRTRDLDRSIKELTVGTAGEVRIGATDSIATYLLPKIIARLLHKHPKISINIITEITPRLFEFAREGEVDFALTLSDYRPRDLLVKQLIEEALCFVTSPKDSVSRSKVTTTEELRAMPFVAGLSGTGHATMVQRVLDRVGISDYKIAVRIATYEGVKRLVCEGFGISVLPRFSVQDEIKANRLIILKLSGVQLGTGIFLVKRLNYPNTPAVSLVEKFIETSISRGRTIKNKSSGAETRQKH